MTRPKIEYPIYDMILEAGFKPALQLVPQLRAMLNCRKHNL